MPMPIPSLLLAPLLVLALTMAGCGRPPAAPEPVRAVRTMVVGSETAAGTVEYAAELRARTESRLGFRVPGKLIQRPAEVGQRVAAGQALARIDGSDLALARDAAQAGLASAQAAHELAAAEYRRYKELREQGFISAIELDRRATALQAQRALLDQARAQAGVQSNQAGYATLSAPAAGVVVGVDAEVGAVLAAGSPVLRLAHDGPRDAVFSVPEDQAAALRALRGRPGAVEVRPWAGGEPLRATVREVAAAADPATRTFVVKAELPASAGAALQLGQTLTVAIAQPPRAGVVKLPLAALMQQQGRSAVWVVEGQAVRQQVVDVAGAEGNLALIAAGLQPGQRVVTAGVHVLAPGEKVTLYAEPRGNDPAQAAEAARRAASAAGAAARASLASASNANPR